MSNPRTTPSQNARPTQAQATQTSALVKLDARRAELKKELCGLIRRNAPDVEAALLRRERVLSRKIARVEERIDKKKKKEKDGRTTATSRRRAASGKSTSDGDSDYVPSENDSDSDAATTVAVANLRRSPRITRSQDTLPSPPASQDSTPELVRPPAAAQASAPPSQRQKRARNPDSESETEDREQLDPEELAQARLEKRRRLESPELWGESSSALTAQEASTTSQVDSPSSSSSAVTFAPFASTSSVVLPASIEAPHPLNNMPTAGSSAPTPTSASTTLDQQILWPRARNPTPPSTQESHDVKPVVQASIKVEDEAQAEETDAGPMRTRFFGFWFR
ncbi:hypothetical protein JCM10296v2_007155 [Rhodotorula toruloides]